MTTQITMTKTLKGTRIEVQGSDAEKVTKVLEAACEAVRQSSMPATDVARSGTTTR